MASNKAKEAAREAKPENGKKLVKKRNFILMSEIPVFESYLSDMAKEGLHFVRRGPTFTYFEAGEPRHMVYRIDVMNTYAHPERLQEYEKKGWELVWEGDDVHVLRAPRSENLIEIYDDPGERAVSMKKFVKSGRRASIAMTVFYAVNFINIGFQVIHDRTPVLDILEWGYFALAGVGIFLIFQIISNIIEHSHSQRLCQQMASRVSSEDDFNWSEMERRTRNRRKINGGALILFCLSAILFSVFKISGLAYEELPESSFDAFPMVRLAAVEPLTQDEMRKDGFYSVEKRRVFLWGPWYHTEEYRATNAGSQMYDYESQESYGPAIENTYIEVPERLSVELAEELVKNFAKSPIGNYWNPDIERFKSGAPVYGEAVPSFENGEPAFDILYIMKERNNTVEPRRYFICASGNRVLTVYYRGAESSERIVNAMADALRYHQ